MAAALQDGGESSPGVHSTRRSLSSKASSSWKTSSYTPRSGKGEINGYPSPPSSLPNNPDEISGSNNEAYFSKNNTALVDGPPIASNAAGQSALSKARARRASEGQHLVKGERRPNGSELRCEKCGKNYKHSSCLTKHLWEHTPEWSYTSKLLISKHQQVQLLEAASVLVAMNQDGTPSTEAAANADSDHSSASPAASGFSGPHDGLSSADTTPPPQAEEQGSIPTKASRPGRPKRYSSTMSGYGRFYQSAPSDSFQSGSAPADAHEFSHHRHSSAEQGTPGADPVAYGKGISEEDEAGLAAALELLSSSFGTPRSGPVLLPPDVPPVPPLPARFLGQDGQSMSGSTATPSNHLPFQKASNSILKTSENDIEMRESEDSVADDEDFDQRSSSRDRSEDDDDGVFGQMEE
ncbi:MAG: hypothetical protein M1819_006137 [Sarea resinae]|nr:MAG: hypothetical protein M1819_006137 [Sarea resinae]